MNRGMICAVPMAALLLSSCTYYAEEYAKDSGRMISQEPITGTLVSAFLLPFAVGLTAADTVLFGALSESDKMRIESARIDREIKETERKREQQYGENVAAQLAGRYGSNFTVVCEGRGTMEQSTVVHLDTAGPPTYERKETGLAVAKFEFSDGAEVVRWDGRRASVGGGHLTYEIDQSGAIIANMDDGDDYFSSGNEYKPSRYWEASVGFSEQSIWASSTDGRDGSAYLRERPAYSEALGQYVGTETYGTDTSWSHDGYFDNCRVETKAS